MPKPVSEMMTSTARVLKPGGRFKSALERINPNAAGIDIGANFLEAIPKDRAQENIRTFGPLYQESTPARRLARRTSIETVAMESTGVYRIPPEERTRLFEACRYGLSGDPIGPVI